MERRDEVSPLGAADAWIAEWRRGQGVAKHFTAIHHVPARDAVYGTPTEPLHPSVRAMLRARGFDELYVHQAHAVDAALRKQNVVVVTPTASGKSLCYHLPVIDGLLRGGNALYMFPTKALSQDQCAELNHLLQRTPGYQSDWEAQVYDGDTPPEVRRKVRRNARLVVTNPDMLHAAILPHHERWAAFLKRLDYVVLDELHTYRGVFGSHVANVIRRLERICAHYDCNPTFIATSATIANPRELAEGLTEQPFELVDRNGAPSAPKTICFLNPPIKDRGSMRRQSALGAAARVARGALTRDLGTIVFTRSRQSVEVLVHRLKERLERDHGHGNLQDRVASYRGGYLPELRRSIEKGLRDGFLRGVISTNALELGIDIGSLDVCILAGYPGSIASTWQQIGRSGRRGTTSIAIVVATDDPMDQFVIQHPEYFFAQPPEFARIDADNLRVAVEHLKCACYELPWKVGEAYGAFDGEETEEMLEFLAHETGMMQRTADRWRWSDRDYPASSVNLRNIAEENFVVVDTTHGRQEILAEVDFESAHTTLYPRAVYQVSGRPYRVERLDYDERRAYVRVSDDGHYTTAMHYTAVHVLDTFEEGVHNQGSIGFGEVCVTQRFVGYKKIRFGTGENVGYGELNLPQLDLHTMSYWLTLPSRHFEDDHDPDVWARVVQGLGTVLETAAALKLMCDPRDIALCIGSVAEDQWLTKSFDGLATRSTSDADQGLSAQMTPGGRVAPALYNPTLFLYDRFPGGVGFGEGLFEEHIDFMRRAYDLVHDCSCEHGCPSCVGPPEVDERPVRHLVERVLMRLMMQPTPER